MNFLQVILIIILIVVLSYLVVRIIKNDDINGLSIMSLLPTDVAQWNSPINNTEDSRTVKRCITVKCPPCPAQRCPPCPSPERCPPCVSPKCPPPPPPKCCPPCPRNPCKEETKL